MDKKEVIIGNQNDSAELRYLLPDFRERYDNLIVALGVYGTEVERTRYLEQDPVMFPYNFVRGDKHRFVFPPQNIGELENVIVQDEDTSYIKLDEDMIMVHYDRDKVEGELLVNYDDSGLQGIFQIEDLHEGESILPTEAQAAIEIAFAT